MLCFVGLLLPSLFVHVGQARHYAVEVPDEWEETNSPPLADTKVTVTLALRQRNISGLARVFDAVTNPMSWSYGRYLSLEQVRSLTDAEPSEVTAVTAWVTSSGVSIAAVEALGDALRVSTEVHHIEALLRTELRSYKHRHIDGLSRIHFAKDYVIPDNVAAFVEFVSGLHAARVSSHLLNPLLPRLRITPT